MGVFFRRYKGLTPIKPTANPYTARLPRWRQYIGLGPFIFLLLLAGGFHLYPGLYTQAQEILFDGVMEVCRVVLEPLNRLSHKSFFIDSPAELHLRQENDELRQEIQRLRALERENTILRQALNIPKSEPYRTLIVPVLAQPYDGMHQFLLLAAGQNKKLEKNQGVISGRGVLGRLDKVGGRVSRVLLLPDPLSRIPVITLHSQEKAILAGEGTHNPILVYLENRRKIKIGEPVVTSGLGGVFPPGLPVGYVKDIVNGKIRVELSATPAQVDWVHVLQTDQDFLTKEMANLMKRGEDE